MSEQKKLMSEQMEVYAKSGERAETARQQKKQEQINCPHKRGFDNNSTRLVFIHDELGGYLMCQKCQVVIRPDDKCFKSMFEATIPMQTFGRATQTNTVLSTEDEAQLYNMPLEELRKVAGGGVIAPKASYTEQELKGKLTLWQRIRNLFKRSKKN